MTSDRIAKLLANTFDDVGSRQLQVCIYMDEAAVFAQVTLETMLKLRNRFALMPAVLPKGEPVLSASGLTWCFLFDFDVEQMRGNRRNWRDVIMSGVHTVVSDVAPYLLGPGRTLDYKDNRYLDLNTVELYASFLEPKTP